MAEVSDETPETAGAIAELYLGNILYALERCALSLAEEGKTQDAAFYRGIGRLLAEARGKSRSAPKDQG
ncbi:MAG: hypothetical protein ACYC0B_07425 [Gemmatimonadaceae bacterium]